MTGGGSNVIPPLREFSLPVQAKKLVIGKRLGFSGCYREKHKAVYTLETS